MNKPKTLRQRVFLCHDLAGLKRMLARYDTRLLYRQALDVADELDTGKLPPTWATAVMDEYSARCIEHTSVSDARVTIRNSTRPAALRLALVRESRKGTAARQGLLASLRSRIRTLEAVR